MLGKAGLAVLDALSPGRLTTPDELATETDYSSRRVHQVLDELIAGGLLTETREHRNQRRVAVTDHPVVEAYRRLTTALGHVEWPDLLSPPTLRLAWYLDEPRRVAEIADRLGVSRRSVHNALAPLKHRAMLDPAGPEYALADDLEPLLEFARAAVEHEHRQRVRALAPSATVEWCDPERALVRVHDPEDTEALGSDDDWQLTGLAGFRQFGLEFYLAGEPAFWYAPDDLSPAELVCHTLLLDADSRRVSYAMLLVETAGIDRDQLAETASWYGLEAAVSAMYRAIAGEVDATDDPVLPLPSDAEYDALREQYGIA